MRILIIYLLVLFPFIIEAQTFNNTDASGKKQGKWTKTYSNGVPRYEGQFKNNMPYGDFKYYYESGSIKAVNSFSPDGIICRSKNYHENGKLKAIGKYIKQKKDSTWTYYSEIDEVVILKENYKHGVLTGTVTAYYPENKKIAELTTYENGEKNGEFKKYFADGTIMAEGYFTKGLPDKAFVSYYPNGKTKVKGKYKNGLRVGEWKYYDEKGKSITEDEFKSKAYEPVKKLEIQE